MFDDDVLVSFWNKFKITFFKNEEDEALKEKMELCVERLGDSNA